MPFGKTLFSKFDMRRPYSDSITDASNFFNV